jgi:YVTN family beta-propeller protein
MGLASVFGVADRLQTDSTTNLQGFSRRFVRVAARAHNVAGAVDNRKMDFRILGSFEVWVGDRLVGLGGEKPRALLAILLLHRNEVVSADRLIDDLWGESPPETALRTLRAYVSRLRKALGANGSVVVEEASGLGANGASPAEEAGCVPGANGGVLLTQGRGYVLEVASADVDLDRFRETSERGRDALAAGRPGEAAAVLRDALGMWRGPPLAEFAYEPFAQRVIARLEELHLAAVEDRVEADLALGRARELVGELRDLVARHPLRERLRGQLMLALYRAGRQAEALEAYQEFRRSLSEELGLEPGPAVKRLELSILGRDPALDLAAGGDGSGSARGESVEPSDGSSRFHRRRLVLAAGAALVALLLVGGLVASGGDRAALTGISGDSIGVVSPSGGAIRAVVPLGTSPSALVAGDGAVWVANYNQGTVSRINPALRAVVQTLQVGSTPTGVAVGAGAVWVTDNYGSRVFRIDPTVDRVVQAITVGNAPTGVAFGDGSVWVANSSDGTLTRIDATTGGVMTTITLGGSPAGVAVGLGGVWVSDEAGDRVVRVDPDRNQVIASINVGAGPTAITVGFGSIWVANSLDGTVSRIDPATDSVEAAIGAGNGAGTIASGQGAVWVANQYAGTVSRIDPVTDTVTETVSVGNRPQGLAFADGLVWVGSQPASTRHRGGTLTILTQVWVDTFDPVLAQIGGGVLQMTNDGLTAYQRVGGSGSVQVVPDLAVSLPSPTDGGTAYTFQLRRGIRFSDGELVRPEDFRRALERDLILGPDPVYGDPFANVVGGAACAAHPRRCDLSRGVVTDDAANTVTFHLVAPDPEFLARLTLTDAVAVPAGAPIRNVGFRPLPATGPYMLKVSTMTNNEGVLVRNPYFHEWSHAARPDGYPDRIVFRLIGSQTAELTAIERGRADVGNDGPPADTLSALQTRFASQLHVHALVATDVLILNTRVAPFKDARVRRAINYAIDRAEIARLLGSYSQPTCQVLPPYLPGYRRYCPYTIDPNSDGVWHAPDLARAEQLIAASHTRGTRITIWNLGTFEPGYKAIGPYLVSLLDRLGYPTQIKDLSSDVNATLRFADSRTSAQAALHYMSPSYLSASQMLQVPFACQSFVPNSTRNANLSEFCDPRLDAQIDQALAAESNNSPQATALWGQADRTVTDEAPVVALDTPSQIDFVSSRVGNYQYSFQQNMLWDQLWVR